MVTSTSIKSPDVIKPPAISMCLQMDEFENIPKNCTKMYVNVFGERRCILEEYSLKDLMTKYSGNLSDELYFWDYDKDFYEQNATANKYFRSKTLQYYYSGHKCVHIPSSIGIELIRYHTNHPYNQLSRSHGYSDNIERRTLEHNLDDIYLLDFFLNIRNTRLIGRLVHLTIFFTEPEKIGHNRDSAFERYFWEPAIEPNVARLNYHQITTKYLKYPFDHDCYEYAKDDSLESKGDCQEKCTKNGTFKKYGRVGRVMSTYTYDDAIPYDAPIIDHEVDSSCIRKCRVDCKTIQYYPVLDFLWFHYRKSVFRIQLLSACPQTFISFSAKFDMLSYLVFVGGIFGMWIGFDLFSSTSSFIDYLIGVCKKVATK